MLQNIKNNLLILNYPSCICQLIIDYLYFDQFKCVKYIDSKFNKYDRKRTWDIKKLKIYLAQYEIINDPYVIYSLGNNYYELILSYDDSSILINTDTNCMIESNIGNAIVNNELLYLFGYKYIVYDKYFNCLYTTKLPISNNIMLYNLWNICDIFQDCHGNIKILYVNGESIYFKIYNI